MSKWIHTEVWDGFYVVNKVIFLSLLIFFGFFRALALAKCKRFIKEVVGLWMFGSMLKITLLRCWNWLCFQVNNVCCSQLSCDRYHNYHISIYEGTIPHVKIWSHYFALICYEGNISRVPFKSIVSFEFIDEPVCILYWWQVKSRQALFLR